MQILSNKVSRLYIGLAAFFLTNAIVAEFMGVKIFSLEETLGLATLEFNLFGETIRGINFTCGVLLWPFVFVMTDIVNEYFGVKGVRFLSYMAAVMIGYAFFMLYAAMNVAPAGWWIFSSDYAAAIDMDKAYNAVFGQGLAIILGSLTAFLVGQLVDVYVFQKLKQITGEKWIWLRATGSTVVSQLIDSFIVLFIAFYLARWGKPNQWSWSLLFAVGTVNYIYKFLMAILMTPVIYGVHSFIDNYLGETVSAELRNQALLGKVDVK